MVDTTYNLNGGFKPTMKGSPISAGLIFSRPHPGQRSR